MSRIDAIAKSLAQSHQRRGVLLLLGAAGIMLGLDVPDWLIHSSTDSAAARRDCRNLIDTQKRKACLKKSKSHGKHNTGKRSSKKRASKRQSKRTPSAGGPAVSPLCSASSCPPGLVCDLRQGCICPEGTKPCTGTCVPFDACCGGCPPDANCDNGVCKGVEAPLPLYPDVRALPPSDLQFDIVDGDLHVLRFSNTIWNAGQGRLELEGDSDPFGANTNYQNLYDEPVGGTRVSHEIVASDFIFHASHNHFHFADFASYRLLTKDAQGTYQPSTQESTKISFCIRDTDHVEGDFNESYTRCSRDYQGLTPGWGDTYRFSLPDQWVVLGDRFLADGEYGLESTADPRNLLNEGDPTLRANNTAVTYFTVEEGMIVAPRHTAVRAN
jgi:hypothetical protein